MRGGFFHVRTREECEELIRSFAPLSAEEADLKEARDRVLAEDVVSPQDLPLVDRSVMDGYAVRARDTFGASESNPAYLETSGDVSVDTTPGFGLEPGRCARIPTGGTLPEGADAVVMVEHTEEMGAGTVEIRRGVAPGENVVLRGEDAGNGDVALEKGLNLTPGRLALLAALGVGRVRVARRPAVGIVSTGDEITPLDAPPVPGKVRDVNAFAVAAMAARAGAEPERLGIVADDVDALEEKIARALERFDVLILSGGSSVGARDVSIMALERMAGVDILMHGMNIKPGKPTILARSGSKPILGLPGHVASAQISMLLAGRPLLRRLQGDSQAFDRHLVPARSAELSRNLPSSQGREDFVRVVLEERGGDLPLARPVLGKSGLLTTMVASDGMVRIPSEAEGLYAGQQVDVTLF